jgi:hypothetical protein
MVNERVSCMTRRDVAGQSGMKKVGINGKKIGGVAGQSGMKKVGINGKTIGWGAGRLAVEMAERLAGMTVLVRWRMVSKVDWANRWERWRMVSKVDWANHWKRWRRGGGRRWMLKLETTSHRWANGGYHPFTPGYQFRLSTTTMPPLRKDVQRRVLPGCATIVGRIGSLRRFIER